MKREIAWPRDLAQEDEHFGSGINDKGEVRGMMLSGRHLGITATTCTRPGMRDELEVGRFGYTRLFVDSGAFGEMKVVNKTLTWPKPITDKQWQKRFAVYQWAAECYRSRAYLVAPDRVGCQKTTIERLQKYALEVGSWAAHGANVIVCIQRGELAAGDFFKLASDVLGLRPEFVIAGVPMEKARWSIDELRAFCETLPWFGARIHLLGLGPKSKRDKGQKLNRYWRAIETIRAIRPNCKITSDSAIAPSISGRDNGPGGGPRIYTALQDEARAKGLQTSSERKAYAFTKHGHALVDETKARAAAQGWRDTELDDEEPAVVRTAPAARPTVHAGQVEAPPAMRQSVELKPETRDGTVSTYVICF